MYRRLLNSDIRHNILPFSHTSNLKKKVDEWRRFLNPERSLLNLSLDLTSAFWESLILLGFSYPTCRVRLTVQLKIEVNRCVTRRWAGYFILSRYYFGLQHKASKVKRERPVEFELYITSMLFLNLLTINALLAIYSVLTILKYWPIGLTMYMTGVPPYFFFYKLSLRTYSQIEASP